MVPDPISLSPSEYWDGDDGKWSTFYLSIGTPGQRVRLLPGTSSYAGNTIWAVLPEGCDLANPGLQDCTDLRGGTFTRNASTSWSIDRLQNGGLYDLDTYVESILGLDGNAYYGFDIVRLPLSGSVPSNFTNVVIAGIATDNYWLGSLGLSPHAVNFTSYNNPLPSFLSQLRNESAIPSTSWAYTAGAVYKSPPVFGSLTLGGYDAERLDNTGLSLPFGAEMARDLLVGLNSITYDTFGSTPLFNGNIPMYIDSMVTQIWLPLEACQAFEIAFGLVWNATSELYLLNATTHARLQAQNPTVTFNLGNVNGSGETTVISIPYQAFDLSILTPTGNLPYFPLKRAQNETQFVLGRVFLQEAYIICDYERHNFTIAQAAFPSSGQQDIHSITAPSFTQNASPSSLSRAAIAGILVAAIVSVSLLILMICWTRIRSRRRRLDKDTSSGDACKWKGLHAADMNMDRGQFGVHIMEADANLRHEADPTTGVLKRYELYDRDSQSPTELYGTVKSFRVELDGQPRVHLQASADLYELPARDDGLGLRFSSGVREHEEEHDRPTWI